MSKEYEMGLSELKVEIERGIQCNPNLWFKLVKYQSEYDPELMLRLKERARIYDSECEENLGYPWSDLRHFENARYAAHEAAHLIAAEILGWTGTAVSIERGNARYRIECLDADTHGILPATLRKSFYQQRILVVLAGPVSDLLYFNDQIFLEQCDADCDTRQAFEFAEKLESIDRKIHDILANSFKEAMRLISDNAASLYEVADQLLKHGKADKKEISHIMKSAEVPHGERWDRLMID